MQDKDDVMEILRPNIEGLFIIKPQVFPDARGYFFESYSKRNFDEAVGYPVEFVQDNQSKSSHGVIRGLHFQLPPYSQAKLVRCIKGKVLDVAVDLRHDSPTFGQHLAVELSEENKVQFFIPRGFAHGFSVLSDEAVFQYKCDNYYTPRAEGGISLDDDSLGIDWKIDPADRIISEKDLHHPKLSELKTPF